MNISGTPEKLGQYLAQRIEQMVRPAFYLLQDWYNQRYSMFFSIAGNGLKMQKMKKKPTPIKNLLLIVIRNCKQVAT